MSKPPAKSVARAVGFAALLSLLITSIRLLGEKEAWAPDVFRAAPGGGLGWFGISFLVVPFGFWFGRRLAQNGRRPAAAGRSALVHVIGIAMVAGVFWLGMKVTEDWRLRSYLVNGGTVLCGLLALKAWPRAWMVLATYGVLARIPVIVAQYLSIQNEWTTHYAGGPPGSDPKDALFLLTMAQATFWPFAFTTLVGGLFATLGAATVRR